MAEFRERRHQFRLGQVMEIVTDNGVIGIISITDLGIKIVSPYPMVAIHDLSSLENMTLTVDFDTGGQNDR